MKKLMYLAAALAVALVGCKDPVEPDPIAPEFPTPPSVVEELLDASPLGNDAEAPLTLNIEAEGAWKIEALDEYDWITVTPESGEANATLTFVVAANTGNKERLAEFEVLETITATNADLVDNGEATTKEVKTYVITINQVKQESNIADGSLAFLRAIVEGKLLGDKTPTVDNWFNVDEAFEGISFTTVDGGKQEINYISGAPLTGWPEVLNLPELLEIRVAGQAGLNGKTFPKEWNSPKLQQVWMANNKMTGRIPEGLGSTTPALFQIFLDGNDFYGTYPHIWASGANGGSGKLEVAILAHVANKAIENQDKLPIAAPDHSTRMGYLVPATLDVRMNNYVDGNYVHNADTGYGQGDGMQIKLGGVFEQNYDGYEAGWGQDRYVKFGGGAADDLTTWHDERYLKEGDNNHPAKFSNLGYPGMCIAIPQVMMTWDEAAAEAYNAQFE